MTDHASIGDAIVRLVDAIEHDEPQNPEEVHGKPIDRKFSDHEEEIRKNGSSIGELNNRVDDLEDNILGELRGISRDRETVEVPC